MWRRQVDQNIAAGRTRAATSAECDFRPNAGDETGKLVRFVGLRWYRAPDRPGPSGVGTAARDDVDVKLRHDVADRRDIELVARGDVLEHPREHGDLIHQLLL